MGQPRQGGRAVTGWTFLFASFAGMNVAFFVEWGNPVNAGIATLMVLSTIAEATK